MNHPKKNNLPADNSQDKAQKLDVNEESWTERITEAWESISAKVSKLLPAKQVEKLTKKLIESLTVSEDEIQEILERVRSELPTTEALLIGKPQAGKSSIVRGLTGVSAEIVGQGFRPHTQHTERYAYPSKDLPLLIFTDTVGLGDIKQNTQAIINELVEELQQESHRARLLILTIKINDFATDALREVAKNLRQQFPNLPCLLAVTCLHELYRDMTADHPEYPPAYEEVQRAFTEIEAAFKDLCDRTVMIDFTLEEDDYHPVFYGLETFRDTLADLLPEAEAKAIYQLLDEDTGEKIGDLYRDVGRRYILAFSVIAATLAAVPLPFATMPVLTTLQVSMVIVLGNLYGQTLTPSQAGGLVSAIAGGFVAQAVGRELVKFLPGFGSVIAASWAAAYTGALGEGACVYFGDLMGGKKPDPEKIQLVMKEAFKEAKERLKGIQG
jgi:uncharacterized protein (DUF697 family)/predicted GTPase